MHLSIKYFFAFLLVFFLKFTFYSSQFESKLVGPADWNQSASWQVINPSVPADLDGIPDEDDTVTIKNGHSINIPNTYLARFFN